MTGKFGVGGDFMTGMVMMCARPPFFLTTLRVGGPTRAGRPGRRAKGRHISESASGNENPEQEGVDIVLDRSLGDSCCVGKLLCASVVAPAGFLAGWAAIKLSGVPFCAGGARHHRHAGLHVL